MKTIQDSGTYASNEFFVFEVTGEVTKLECKHLFDDLTISSPDGDILFSWDTPEFDENKCMLLKAHDNLKDFGNMRINHLFFRAVDVNSKPLKIYINLARN